MHPDDNIIGMEVNATDPGSLYYIFVRSLGLCEATTGFSFYIWPQYTAAPSASFAPSISPPHSIWCSSAEASGNKTQISGTAGGAFSNGDLVPIQILGNTIFRFEITKTS